MPNSALSEAITEAYASAPSDTIILHTLEIRHPAFIDEDGNSDAIRVVSNFEDFTANLESTSAMNAGEPVLFRHYPFSLTLPPITDKSTPSARLTIDNVSRLIVSNIELAVESLEVIRVIYRPYLSTDLSGPQYDPPIELVLSDITANVFSVSGTATFGDLANKSFPRRVYDLKHFPGLAR